MQEMILLKVGELALKGLNRSTFEAVLIKNIRRRLKPLGEFSIQNAQSTLYVTPKSEDIDLNEAVEQLSRVFGIAALNKARVTEKRMDAILEEAPAYLEDTLLCARTFKVEAKRADKAFPLKSPDICREMGGRLLEAFPHLKVDVHHPDVTVMVEVRDFGAYIHAGSLPGAGGMPVGTAGRAALLISGGIDSPVAGYMIAKRGVELTAVHFASPPYTSERAERKVVELLEQVACYAGRIKLVVVPFTELQEAIKAHCPQDLFTILMRRFMMRIAQELAEQNGCQALVTGESVGQVASQTMAALACTDAVARMPVFRPVIGMDKDEIVTIARKIGTFDISIQPYEDCCTVFTPRHPKTRPNLEEVEKAEEAFEWEEMVRRAIGGARAQMLYADGNSI